MKDFELPVRRMAFTGGLLFAVGHAVLTPLIALTQGKAVEAWLASDHIRASIQTFPLDPVLLITGTITAGIGGFVLGAAFAWIWNHVG